MSLKKVLLWNRCLFIANFLVLIALCTFFTLSLTDHFSFPFARKEMTIVNQQGKPVIFFGSAKNGEGVILLNNQEGNIRLQLQGGEHPSVFIKNETGEVVGTFFAMKDGGAAVGLGDQKGHLSTLVRGGAQPGVGLYQNSIHPKASIGISSSQTPHLILFSEPGKNGIVLQSSDPATMLFIDEKGEVPVILSKYGLAQQEQESPAPSEPKKKYYHSNETVKLFLEDYVPDKR